MRAYQKNSLRRSQTQVLYFRHDRLRVYFSDILSLVNVENGALLQHLVYSFVVREFEQKNKLA